MPYASNDERPGRVRLHLPKHTQDIYCAAFYSALQKYDPLGPEDIADRVAWAAVKVQYRKEGSEWVPLEP